ncbi:MAG: TonB-dependent receptor [Rhodanobacter sp.]|nr:MAG: TonB-dependent receptor [Rhodanobacter sp.]
MSLGGVAMAQSTSGSIFGQAPVASGETITVQSASGVKRTVDIDQLGHYNVGSLPVGTYKVTLQRDGKVISSRSNVVIRVGSGTEVSFSSASAPEGVKNLDVLTVTANALPTIDVSSVDSRTVITSQQLRELPLGRSTEAIALLSPGAIAGSTRTNLTGPTGNQLVSFGGAGVTENAYYINGMNVTDPLNGLGGIDLPYGSIEQVELLTGGYGAAYGRSDGGVLNQIGKRGTNDWHFGARVLYTPDWAKSDPVNINYPAANSKAGQLRQFRGDNKGTTTTESAYVGGPLIRDKLFLFASVEAEKATYKNVSSMSSTSTVDRYQYDNPKWYAKLDWNINDSNILELTGASTKHSRSGNTYAYDYNTRSQAAFISADEHTKVAANMWIAKYTGYLTDSLTLSAQYGKQVTDLYSQLPAGFDPTLISVIGGGEQDPALSGGGGGITNSQIISTTVTNPAHQTKGANYRLDVTYILGDHTITAGIDNQQTQDLNDGDFIPTNAGFVWEYAKQNNPQEDISLGQVSPAGGQGYYVDKYRRASAASVRVEQRAQYIEDTWQVTDRWIVKAGLRNDQFTNYNSDSIPYIRQTKPQWAPRLGASWDVNGDSSFKVYANAGRYYLALPTSVALRGASGSLFTREYYNYTGIDPVTGYPTGLTPINTINGPGVPYSSNNEYGQAPDPRTVTATNLKAQYQDEYIAGFDKKFNDAWTYGAKLTYRSLKNAIDDTCNKQLFISKAQSQGLDTTNIRGCYFFNPGRGATFQVPNGTGGYGELSFNSVELGYAHAKRNYYSANLFLEHPYDGTWYGRLDYTYARSYGNTEGQVKSDIGQNDIAATQDWDYPSLMQYAGGQLANSRQHQLKIYGSYKVLPEWTVSGLVSVISGAPTDCLGYYGPNQTTPAYPGPYYHWCNGKPAPAGSAGNTPWTKTVNVNLEYRPEFADKKLAFNVQINNLFDEQVPTTLYAYNTSFYRLVQGTQTPRYVRFGVTYDY